MRRNRVFKKIISAALAAILAFQPAASVPWAPAVEVSAQETVQVGFAQSYAGVGKPLQAVVSGAENPEELIYKWYVDDVKLAENSDTHVPDSSELQKTIRVEVYSGIDTADQKLGEAEMFFSRIPVVYIDTENGVGITSKEDYVNADMKIQGNETYGEEQGLYDGAIEIRGRGNATWNNPKKPYKLKLSSSSNLFGMGSSKHWVLLANYTDNSLLRNKISYDFSGAMGMPYMQSVHVEVILNGTYLGNYLFCEQVKLEEDRVNVESFEAKIKAAAKAISKKTGVDKDDLEEAMMTDLGWVTSDKVTFQGKEYKVSDYCEKIDITGGYLLELDYYDDEVSQIITGTGKRVKFKDPEYAVTNDEVYGYVKDYLNTFETAIHSSDFHAEYQGKSVHYSELFDMESLVEFWLVQEVFFNWDGMNNSNYMYKDVDGLIHFGPIWDMDLTAGNGGTGSTTTWQTFGFDFWQHPNQWYRSITRDPYFIVQAWNYYHSIRDTLITDMVDQISELGAMLEESGKANKVMWKGADNYSSSVNGFKTWMTNHLKWMDEQFASPEQMISSLGQYKEYTYTPSSKIRVTVDESGELAKAAVEADGIAEISYYVNGQFGGNVPVENGKVEVTIENELLKSDGTWNTIQVFDAAAKDVSNFAAFEKQAVVEPEEFQGTAVIKGNAISNATLSFDTADLNDEIGSIQWMADGQPIEGEKDAYYRVTPDMEGREISVVLTGKEREGQVVSEPTQKIAAPKVPSDHLIINQVYGGGGTDGVPVSHSYIELYNPTETDVDLSGYSIGYLSNRSSSKAGSTSGTVHSLQLQGTLPAKAFYLIRCAAENTAGAQVILEITQFDQEWEQTIDNKQYQVMLMQGDQRIDGVAVNEAALEDSRCRIRQEMRSFQRTSVSAASVLRIPMIMCLILKC